MSFDIWEPSSTAVVRKRGRCPFHIVLNVNDILYIINCIINCVLIFDYIFSVSILTKFLCISAC